MTTATEKPLWAPTAERVAESQMTRFAEWLAAKGGLHFGNYHDLWQWSVDHLEDFWAAIWGYFDVRASTPYASVLEDQRMPGAKWFVGARLNIAEQMFRFHQDDGARVAIIGHSEARPDTELSWDELRWQVTAVANSLRRMGVQPGDRVAAYMPNVPETAVAFYACASIGAVWSVCSPDMGTPSVVDRFGQITPKVLFVADGYRYGGRDVDRRSAAEELRAALPSVQEVVALPYLYPDATIQNTRRWTDLLAHGGNMRFEQVPFDHPLWIVYSSGTTGLPKPIVHGQGGALIEYLKALGLNLGMTETDRFFWFSTTGWIVWNTQMAGLLVGATITVFDGNPGVPDLGVLWRIVAQDRIDIFGAGAAYFGGCMKAGITLEQQGDLSRLRQVNSTGSPLSPELHEWIYEQLGQGIHLISGSGGTDVASCFVAGCDWLPLYSGEIQAPCLGVAVYAFNEHGKAVVDEVGELVVTKPMPSMPLYFWNDADNKRYVESYFDTYPGIWRHGDWMRITPRGGAIIYGRSDTTINRHGVRMGTADIYRAIESMPEILDCMVVDLEYLGRESYMPLFVVLRPGMPLDDSLIKRINASIRSICSPRHVPDEVFAVPEIPRTLTGKKMELPIKKLLLGAPPEAVANPDAMSNPSSLAWYVGLASQLPRRSLQATT